MKVGVIGTRGIPNEYGGFEQFATHFSAYLAEEGIEVWVYNSSNHSYKAKTWNGVNIQHIYDPESWMGTSGQFVYDLLSILDARKKNFDIILQLGYTSSTIWGFLFPKGAQIITNMDGLEWKRSKYNRFVKAFLKIAERWGVKQSHKLIADSEGIQRYLNHKYGVASVYIPYGASRLVIEKENEAKKKASQMGQYDLVIARFEPENNIETIIQAHLHFPNRKLFVVGSFESKYGKCLNTKYGDKVSFLGGIYDDDYLNELRFNAELYFHGHSVGGTNPSLLEAMACGCRIIAHDNEFNKAVLGGDAYYFKDKVSLQHTIQKLEDGTVNQVYIENNYAKLIKDYSHNSIHSKLKTLFEEVV